MKQVLNFLTIGVKDLDVMRKFYTEKFGWTPMIDTEGIAFFKLNGLLLGLYPERELAEDIGIAQDGSSFKRITLAINFRSEEEVDKAMAELKEKGVWVIREAEKVFWGGYRGYVADAEDNYWELAYNPFVEMDEKGNITGYKS